MDIKKWKPTRRQLLKAGMIGGAGMMLPFKWLPKARAQIANLPFINDPLYTAPIADPAAIPQFINPLPVIGQGSLASLRRDVTGGGGYTVTMGMATQSLLGTGHMTPVWGYDVGSGLGVTYPGGTFVAKSGVPVTVTYVNNLGFDYILKNGAGDLPVVDTTLHWAFGQVPGSFADDGIPAVVHQHGGHTDSDFDGLPEQWFTQGGLTGNHYATNVYTYDHSQEAGTLWYHDHALGITRTNVYAGLAGFWFLRDNNENSLITNNMIPSGNQEIEIVVQDRMFYPDGRLAYPDAAWVNPDGSVTSPSHQPEFFGQVILVNGKAWPFLNVEPRQYRFRLLNGSDSRFYVLEMKGGPNFWIIGNDVGLLNAPVPVSTLTIGPGERYDVVVDFSGTLDGRRSFAGRALNILNSGRSPFPKGATVNPNLDGKIMQFRVGTATTGGTIAPLTATTNLRPNAPPVPVPNTNGVQTRKLMLFEATDQYGRLQPLLGTVNGPNDGTFLWDDDITETMAYGATEVWEVHNATVDAHPIHLHLVRFQIANRQKYRASVITKDNANGTTGGALRNIKYKGRPKGPAAYESGWKDTAIMYPGEVTRILIDTFDKSGRWVWHCHILSHEDHEMMRPYEVAQPV
jgi:spore coat protein A